MLKLSLREEKKFFFQEEQKNIVDKFKNKKPIRTKTRFL